MRPRLERQRRVALVERLRDRVRMRGNLLVEDVVLVQGDDSEPPAGTAEVLAVGVDANGVPAGTRRAASGIPGTNVP